MVKNTGISFEEEVYKLISQIVEKIGLWFRFQMLGLRESQDIIQRIEKQK